MAVTATNYEKVSNILPTFSIIEFKFGLRACFWGVISFIGKLNLNIFEDLLVFYSHARKGLTGYTL